jgi:iron(III) transport system permease protein
VNRLVSAEGPPGPRWPRLATAAVGGVVAVMFALPFAYLVIRAGRDWSAVWDALVSARTAGPLWRTIQLTLLVSAGATALGVGLAWLTVRTDLPGRKVWRVTAVLPLVIPSFVGAAAWKLTFERRGILEEWFGITSFPEMRGLTGATVVLVLFTYPYVYLPVAARLASLPPSLEENARILGRSPAYAFGRIVLPQCASAIAVGTLFVALYTVSDFGAVQLMSYDTLTRRLFANQLRQRDVATAMGLLLALLALVITVAERMVVRRLPPTAGIGARRALHVPLGRWRGPAVGAVIAVTIAALVAPITVFAWWIWRGASSGAPRSVSTDLVGPALSSAQAGIVAAVVAVIVVLPLAMLTVRQRSRTAGVAGTLVVAGFALPGLVTAFAVGLAVRGTALYLTFPVLIAAYVLHFGGQALRATQSSVGAVPARLGEAARLLGASRWRRLTRVELPLMAPGLVAGGGLVLLSVLKELPITLLLRPDGMTPTLAQRIYATSEEALRVDTGLASLVLIGLSAVLTWLLVIRRMEHL